MAEKAFNFIVSNADIVVKFSCNNHKKRIDEIVRNLFVDKTDSKSAVRMMSKFASNDNKVSFCFDGDDAEGHQIMHDAVFFENTDYPLIVKGFSGKRLQWVDMVVAGHKRSDTEKKSQIISDGGELYGTLNFKNQVGETDFCFRYQVEGSDEISELSFASEVLSYKLDYRSDLKTIIADVEQEYALLSYSFLKDTYQHFRRGAGENTELIWWQIFRECFNDIIRNTKLIIDRPKRRLRTVPRYERAERLTVIPRELENEYQVHKDNPAYLYRTEELILSHDTIENRFLKHALREMHQKFISIRQHIMLAMKLSDPSRIGTDIDDMEEQLLRVNNHPFFRGVGQFKGFTQDSLVMKQGLGYKTILEKWIALQQGYELAEGLQRLEVKDISDLYEIWCFIKVKNIVQEVLNEIGSETKPKVNGKDVTRDFIPQLVYGGSVSFINQNGIELASVAYNAEVEQERSRTKSAIEGTDTLTTVQRPDIVLRLSKEGDDIKYTYLFDAKYRINDTSIEGEQVPPEDAIDQLHRYRDAIYWNKDKNLKKEIVAGYVLFPGTVSKEKMEDGTYYYQRSNQRIGIGAFPLKPDHEIRNDEGELIVNPDSTEIALQKQIREWLTVEDNRQHILEKSIPQHGLEYEIEGKKKVKCLLFNLLGSQYESCDDKLQKDPRFGVAIQDGGNVLELDEGLTTAAYLIITNKRECKVFFLDVGKKPIFLTQNDTKNMLTTKSDALVHLVFHVDTSHETEAKVVGNMIDMEKVKKVFGAEHGIRLLNFEDLIEI